MSEDAVESKQKRARLGWWSGSVGCHLDAHIGQPNKPKCQSRARKRALRERPPSGPGDEGLADEDAASELERQDDHPNGDNPARLGGELVPNLPERENRPGQGEGEKPERGAGVAPDQEAEPSGGSDKAGEETDGRATGPEECAHARRIGLPSQRLVSGR